MTRRCRGGAATSRPIAASISRERVVDERPITVLEVPASRPMMAATARSATTIAVIASTSLIDSHSRMARNDFDIGRCSWHSHSNRPTR